MASSPLTPSQSLYKHQLEGIVNFRDVAELVNSSFSSTQAENRDGLEGKTGRTPTLRQNVLYRSARPDRATSKDILFLVEQAGVRTIVDLRGKAEIKVTAPILLDDHFATVTLRPSSSPSDLPTILHTLPPRVAADALPAQPEAPAAAEEPKKRSFSRIRYRLDFSGRSFLYMSSYVVRFFGLLLYTFGFKRYAARLFIKQAMNPAGLKGLYLNFVDRCQAGIRDSLKIIANPENQPVLIHCTQGKDRTGIVVALALYIVGVPLEVILHDYRISRDGLGPEVEAMLEEMSVVGMDPAFLESPPEAMRATFAYLESKYGSIEKFLDHIGVGEDMREKLRQTLLVEEPK